MAEDAWHALRATVGFAATDRRVQRLQYNDTRRGVFTSEVGYLENDGDHHWLATAAFEPVDSEAPWIIALMRISGGGPVWRNSPISVGRSSVLKVTDFLAAG